MPNQFLFSFIRYPGVIIVAAVVIVAVVVVFVYFRQNKIDWLILNPNESFSRRAFFKTF